MNTTLFYRCVVTCTPSSQFINSNTVMVTVNPSPTVVINGTNFIGVTSVKFNGVSATFTINTAIQITAVIPVGATTTQFL